MNFTTSNFTTKDSGKREQFTSGMVRDTQDGKTNFALVFSGPMLERWAALLTRGAVKYERDNWMKASGPAELQRFQESAARHFAQWMRGDTDEDHAAAVYFNICGAEYVKERMREESDCEAIERWNRDIFDTDGYSMNFNDKPPATGPSIPQGDGDDGGSPFDDEAECKEWVILSDCYCKRCDFKHDYNQGLISSTPGQVREPSFRPVDEG